MTDLLLKPAPARGPNDYEVIADDWIVDRIVLSDVSPAEAIRVPSRFTKRFRNASARCNISRQIMFA